MAGPLDLSVMALTTRSKDMNSTDKLVIYDEIKGGGEWLVAARMWMQGNINRGDSLAWSSGEPVSVPFCKLEEFARRVAISAIAEDRRKRHNAEAVRREASAPAQS